MVTHEQANDEERMRAAIRRTLDEAFARIEFDGEARTATVRGDPEWEPDRVFRTANALRYFLLDEAMELWRPDDEVRAAHPCPVDGLAEIVSEYTRRFSERLPRMETDEGTEPAFAPFAEQPPSAAAGSGIRGNGIEAEREAS